MKIYLNLLSKCEPIAHSKTHDRLSAQSEATTTKLKTQQQP